MTAIARWLQARAAYLQELTRPSSDAVFAAGCGAIAAVVYTSTLAPGLISDLYTTMDTPKFQYVGAVLGVPHHPGYPLYVALTWLASLVPIGSVAYRINLFSALVGALSIALFVRLLLRLGCRQSVAAATGLACAFTLLVWEVSIIAEVYTLANLLLIGTTLALVTWRQTRRSAHFYVAVGGTGLMAAHHTSDLLVVPALAVYALSVDARWVLRPSVLARAALIVVACLSSYLLIILRTVQGAPYVESPAHSLAELWGIMRGSQFSSSLFHFGLEDVLGPRLQGIARMIVEQMEPAGLALAALGCIAAFYERWHRREGVLLALWAGVIVAFVANYDAADIFVFLIPALLPLWALAGFGLEGGLRWMTRLTNRRAPVAVAAAIILVAVPGGRLAANFQRADLRNVTFHEDYFAALFSTLPTGSALVSEEPTHLVRYEVLANGRRGREDVTLLATDPLPIEARLGLGQPTYAFAIEAAKLQMLGFHASPVQLYGRPVTSLVDRQPRGSLVAIVIPPSGIDRFRGGLRPTFAWAGGNEHLSGRGSWCYGLIGVAGAPPGSALERRDRPGLTLGVESTEPIGSTEVASPASIRVSCAPDGAEIVVGGRSIVYAAGGAVLVVSPSGVIVEAAPIAPDSSAHAGLYMERLPLYEVMAGRRCQAVSGSRWADATAMTRHGSVIARIPRDASLTLLLLAAERLRPSWPHVSSNAWAHARTAPVAGTAAHRVDIALDLESGGAGSVMINAGGLPDEAFARATGHVELCAAFPGDEHVLSRPEDAVAFVDAAGDTELLGHGWGDIDADPYRRSRRLALHAADILLPLIHAAPVTLTATIKSVAAGARLELAVNGRDTGSRRLEPGWSDLTWTIPGEVIRSGTNQLRFRVRDGLPTTVGIAKIVIRRQNGGVSQQSHRPDRR